MYDTANIKATVEDLIQFLGTINSGSYFAQMHYLQGLIDLIEQRIFLLSEQINSAELRGRSGSVWNQHTV
jgi:hypothetical protein